MSKPRIVYKEVPDLLTLLDQWLKQRLCMLCTVGNECRLCHKIRVQIATVKD
jgi:hypothetical protein